MEQLIVQKRSGLEVELFRRSSVTTVTKAEQRVEFLGENVVNISVESSEPLDITIGDTINVFGDVYRINKTPSETKSPTNRFLYDITFESILYDLKRPQWMLPASVGFATTGDEPLTSDLKGFADVLIYNAKRVLGSGAWVLGVCPLETEIKTLSFPGEKLLSVLQKLCKEYAIEFEIITLSGVNTINFKAIGNVLADTFEHGRGNELYTLQRGKTSDSLAVTRLYAFGSTKNLKSGYRNYSSRLRMSVNPESYIQDASIIDPEAEIIEDTEYFEDIFPERTGVVSGLVANDITSFIDSSMDFDLNEADENGTKWLVPQTAAIISFTTGSLAGYEFEIKEGGYNHTNKTFTIIPFKDERGQIFPDPKSEAFRIKAGDKFKILNINMPDSYVLDAEQRLFDRATERLNDISKRKIQYSLMLNEMFFVQNASEYATVNYFKAGDSITVIDDDLKVNESIRIVSFTRDLLRPYRYAITVSESFDIRIIYELIEDNKNVKDIISRNQLSDPARSRRNWKTTNELSTMLETLRSEMLLIYVEGGAYTTDIVSETNADANENKFRTSAGIVQHDEYLENGGVWNISAFETILTLNAPYFIYIKASKVNNTASIVVSTTRIAVDQDAMFYHLPFGILSSVFNGARVLSSTKGYTRITGNNIHTGRLVSNDGTMWIDLDTGEIRGTFRFTSGEKVEDVIQDKADTAKSEALIGSSEDATNKDNALKGVIEAYADNAAQNAYNELTGQLKGMAYKDVVALADLGETVISGGKLTNTLIDTDYIKVNVINAGYIETLDFVAKKIRTGIAGARIEMNVLGDGAMRAFNSENQENFSIVNGNVVLVGKVTATSGKIAAFDISGQSLSSGSPWTLNDQFVSLNPGDLLFRKVGASTAQVIEMAFGYAGLGFYDGLRLKNTIVDTFGTNTALSLEARGGRYNYALNVIDGHVKYGPQAVNSGSVVLVKGTGDVYLDDNARYVSYHPTTSASLVRNIYLPSSPIAGRVITFNNANTTGAGNNPFRAQAYVAGRLIYSGNSGNSTLYINSQLSLYFDGSNWYVI